MLIGVSISFFAYQRDGGARSDFMTYPPQFCTDPKNASKALINQCISQNTSDKLGTGNYKVTVK